MKFKKVNSGCFDGSSDGMLKPDDMFSSEAVMFRHGIDPCSMLESSTKPLNLAMATGSSNKIDAQYPCYASTPTTPTYGINTMGMGNFTYPPYYNHLAAPSVGLDTMVNQHRQPTDNLSTLSAASHYPQKYNNNNMTMQYPGQQMNNGMTHFYSSQ